MIENLSTLDRIAALERIIDQLVEAKGLEKCGLICVAGDLIKYIRNDVLILEDKAKSNEQSQEDEPVIQEGE